MNRCILICLIFLIAIAASTDTLEAQPAPNFTITTTHNETVSLYEDYLDQGKTVLIKIMFVNCPPCNSIAPHLEPLYQDWGGGNGNVEFIELSNKSWDDNADMATYAANHGLTFPGAGADGGSLDAVQPYLTGTFGPYFGTPTFAVIAPDRSVQFNVDGAGHAATIDSLDAAIQRAMQGGDPPDTAYVFSGQVIAGPPLAPTSLAGVQFYLDVPDPGTDMLVAESDAGGNYSFELLIEDVPLGSSIRPMLDGNSIDGITTFDLFLLMKRMTGAEPFDSDLQIIQSDVNEDTMVNILDLIDMRKLVLGIYNSFPSTTAIKFASTEPVSNGGNLLLYSPYIPILSSTTVYEVDFYGLKMGDLNNSFSF